MRKAIEQDIADLRPFVRVIQGDDEEFGMRLLDHLEDRTFVLQNSNNLNIWLIGDGSHHQLPHQAWPICYQHLDFLHTAPLDEYLLVWEKEQVQLSINEVVRENTERVPKKRANL